MLFSKLGAMFRQVSEQQAGRQAGRQAVHLFLAVATAGQRGRSWVTERERREEDNCMFWIDQVPQ